ncbi:MAG: PIG-L family deacetylase [Alphaproteobacteria bacterium]|nr:PIG-L family deacetylase [Alphaproteobacteria bacterium]
MTALPTLTEDHARLDALAAASPLTTFWRALAACRSPLSFLQVGAHPDDEWSALLARLAILDGVAVTYACATRGDGGQNAISAAAGADLAALRTAEMMAAAEAGGFGLVWLTAREGDPIRDFGFSKSAEDTTRRWGGLDRLVDRIAHRIRALLPDAIAPTFLDVPGQHGHHRAVTRATLAAVTRAADPRWVTDRPAWRVPRVVLPAFTGAGGTYDDSEPPPSAMLGVEIGRPCPVLGLTPEQLGQISRRHHASQGMGTWPEVRSRRLDLHVIGGLPAAPVDGTPGDGLFVGLKQSLADYGRPVAAQAIASALTYFPDRARVADALAAAWRDLGRPERDPMVAARLSLMRTRVERALAAAAFAQLSAVPRTRVVVGATAVLHISAAPLLPAPTPEPVLPPAWSVEETDAPGDWLVSVPADASLGTPDTDGIVDPPPLVQEKTVVAGVPLTLPLPVPLVVEPSLVATIDPATVMRRQGDPRPAFATLRLEARQAIEPGTLKLDRAVPFAGLRRGEATTLPIAFGPASGPGLVGIEARLEGEALVAVRTFDHGPIHRVGRVAPAAMSVLTVKCSVAAARVGYLGGGLDRIDHWLGELGYSVQHPDPAKPDGIDTLMIGVCAFGVRRDLAPAAPALRRWVQAGGHLVTFYHRPQDGWDPATIPPRPVEIGQPSLRWRVTDPTAPVRMQVPDHPLLSTPNRIDDTDWQGWRKERGLYFARRWDEIYETLLAIADPGEAEHEGALLSARIGQGRHTHVALSLHTQLDALVPGAFRLLANLASPA